MPPRSFPTARQQRLGAELRKLRERAGMTGREAGSTLGGNQIQISHIESGRYGVSGTRVRQLAAHYSATDQALVEALVAMAEERGKGWWEEYRDSLAAGFLDLAELEHHATRMHTVQMLYMPGLLQTEAYARAVFAGGVAELPPAEIDLRVDFRMRRREVLDQAALKEFELIIHEAALRIRYGSREIMRAQLSYLAEMAERSNITVRLIPFDADELSGSAQSMFYACGPIPQMDTVQVDAVIGSGFLDAEAQLAKYRALLAAMEQAALSTELSRQRIRAIVQEM
ncbi:helix-turn-helix domain-containing protein [Streptomyces sp. So13.3]|uniref:helix-turn-helix domain-containing protein n=1 Tax=Streptomyces TaxID=1883 RepID=UPI00164E9B61|nr:MULTISPECIES: helix-turn-helix transcriptional regulator [Streptomyces]MCZ4100274.1 helix-turn-helix transcriptional regulator [Streptomyces sp. H39-C1]QNA73464.1 helix-turn-helix domain-containing protein [Streptomyces sp. So13.3]